MSGGGAPGAPGSAPAPAHATRARRGALVALLAVTVLAAGALLATRAVRTRHGGTHGTAALADAAGEVSVARVTSPAPATLAPRRIIAVAPSAAELLFALGLGSRVVGVGEYVAWPPAARRLPRLGGLLDPRLESVAALRPDLAVLLPSERELGERLSAMGVPVLVVPHETIGDVEAAARTVAARAGVPASGERLARELERALAPAPLPGAPRVLLVVERQRGSLGQLLLAGPHTFLDELLGRLGARNACADAPLAWPQVSLEEVLARRPDVVVDLQPHALDAAEAAALRADWRRAPGLDPRVRVAAVGGDWALVPGPRLPLLYRALRQALVTAAPP